MVCNDRTNEFHEIAVSLASPSSPLPQWPTPARLTPSAFGRAARPLHYSIVNMRTFLRSQSRDYMNLERFVTSHASKMSDVERDALEKEVANFGKICGKKIEALAATIGEANNDYPDDEEVTSETLVHQRSVIVCLCNEVKELGDELKALKAFRTQRASIQLQAEKKTILPVSMDTDTFEAESPLSSTELAELQEENLQLRQSFNNDLEAIQAAERGMAEIGQMCEVFSMKVLEQEEAINQIYQNVITSTVNIKTGDEELRKAERATALPLMFLILMIVSFSLMFLHWYSR